MGLKKSIKKENEKEILDLIEKAGDSENYQVSYDDSGIPSVKKKSEIKKGRTSKAQGAKFELTVRENLESKGWIIDKWSNNVDLELNKITPAKRVYNPFRRALVIGTGFPDFIAIQYLGEKTYRIIGVEVKINGILSKIEKDKCKWYLDKKIFSEIWIAKKEKNGRKVEIQYVDFREKYYDKK